MAEWGLVHSNVTKQLTLPCPTPDARDNECRKGGREEATLPYKKEGRRRRYYAQIGLCLRSFLLQQLLQPDQRLKDCQFSMTLHNTVRNKLGHFPSGERKLWIYSIRSPGIQSKFEGKLYSKGYAKKGKHVEQ